MKLPDYSGQRYLVLGLGESGLAMARWLSRCGAEVRVADSRPAPPLDMLARDCPAAEIVCGEFSSALLQDVSSVALSPGLSVHAPLLAEARSLGIPVSGEIELFVQALQSSGERERCRLLAITGTNGKTTTTTLVGELVRAAGSDAAVAGNISPAALAALMDRIDSGRLPDVWVLELSSFQMETTRHLGPDAATVLNVTDDHLDRHGSLAQYAAEKARVFEGSGVMVLNRQDEYSIAMARPGRKCVSFGLNLPASEQDFGVREVQGARWIVRGDEVLLPCSELPLAGDHNISNALAALALGCAINLPVAPMLDALKAFKGLPHRVERVAERDDGVVFYDDSKGTNVGATLAALQGLGRKVVLIAGGDGKGQDFSPLREAFRVHARAVVLIGRDASRIEAETAGCGIECQHASNMEEAVWMASQCAMAGDAILLSPACASLDMFRNYAHRAEVFVAAVMNLQGVHK